MSDNSIRKRKPYKPRWPWESYGPEWKELWLKAAREPFHIDFPNSTRMNSTLIRAHHYRKLAQERNEPGWRLLYRGTTSKDKLVAFRLHFLPVEDPHKEAFAQAGIVVSNPGEGAEMDKWMEQLVEEKKPEGEPSQ